MSYRVLRCKTRECRARIFWATSDRGRRLSLTERPVPRAEALEDWTDVYHLDDNGRALPWTPMLVTALDVELYRAHRATCRAPRPTRQADVEREPLVLVPAPEPDLQLRMPVLPPRFTKRQLQAAA